ncbi:hypothetical protein ACLJJ6_07095 [Pediococcus siamensis]|uniref:hypothetical protein n=1 Tax=Pediococcus siamensis TaxID=381829 RepID=UPI0039A366A8
MTSSFKLLQTLFRQRSTSVHKIFGLQIVALIVTVVILFFKQHFEADYPAGFASGYGVVAAFVLFFSLLVKNEDVWKNSVYRLLPISNTKLYIANFFSSLLSFIYFLVLELILFSICTLTDLEDFSWHIPSHALGYVSSGLALFLTILLASWTFISMVHLLGDVISKFLPDTSQKLVRLVLYILVFVLVSNILSTIGAKVGDLFTPLFQLQINGTSEMDQIITPLFFSSGILLLWSFLYSVVNIYLLSHWTEVR